MSDTRPACGCCPDTVVVVDGAACLATIATPASERLSFVEKELQQLVHGQETATCKSVQVTGAHSDDRRQYLVG